MWHLVSDEPYKAAKIAHAIFDGLVSPLMTMLVVVIYIFRRFYKRAVVRKRVLSFASMEEAKRQDALRFERGKFGRFLMAAFTVWFAVNYANKYGLNDLIVGTDSRVQQVLAMCPEIRTGPAPPIWFSSRHIQFIPWMVQNEIHKLWGGIPFERHNLEVTDRLDKADPAGEQSPAMKDLITIDVFPPFDDPENLYGFPPDAPVILFAPGLRCHSQDIPGNSIVRVAYSKGFRSVAVNRRGHTPGEYLKAPRFNLFGDVDDLEQVYWHVKDNLIPAGTSIHLEGVSSGCAVVVSALGEWDKRRKEHPKIRTPTFTSAVVVTPGYDTSKVRLKKEEVER